MQKVGTEENRADLMTKAVTAPILEKLRGSLGLRVLALAVAAPGAQGEMWPEKVSDKVCAWSASEVAGISLAQLMFYALLVGMMAGIIGALMVQSV